MKKLYAILILFLVASFARYPTEPLKGDIHSIELRYGDENFKEIIVLINDADTILEIKSACGTQWYYLFPMVSNEGYPSWNLTVNYKNGSTSRLYVDDDEVGESSNPNSALYKYLNEKF